MVGNGVAYKYRNAKISDFNPIPEVDRMLNFYANVKPILEEKQERRCVNGEKETRVREVFSSWPFLSEFPGLVIAGPVGVGKTYLASAIANHIAENGIEVPSWDAKKMVETRTVPHRFASALELVDEAKGAIREGKEELNWGRFNGLLILDDLTGIRQTEFALDLMTRIIRHRYDSMLPLVVTTHTTHDDIASIYGAAIASRLLEVGEVVSLKGGDRRRMKIAR